MNRRVFKRSIGAAVTTTALGVCVLILGVIMVARSNICGLGFIVLASIFLIAIGIYMFLDRRPQISISENGLWVRSIGAKEIPWNAMAFVELKWWPRSGNLMTITLINGEKYTFFAEGLQVSPSDLLQMIKEHIDQANQE